VLTLLPERIAFQDLGALLARQPAVARWQQHLIASPFGTIHVAMFTLPRPVGTAIPHPPIYALANFDPLDITASIGRQRLGDPTTPLQFPKANRRAKGDSLVERPRQPIPPLPSVSAIPSEAETAQKKDEADGRFEPYAKYEFVVPDDRSSTPDVDLPYLDLPPADLTPVAPPKASKDAAQLYFGIDPMAAGREAIAPWAPGEAPVVLASRGDPDIKQSALGSSPENADNAGESVANKGEVTGIDQRPRSPAERLALTGVARAKAEKCLANAVYFESRGESVRGQIAVAQVVMNRVFPRSIRMTFAAWFTRTPIATMPVNSPSLATAFQTSSPSPMPGSAPSASRATCSTASYGCQRCPNRPTITRTGYVPTGWAR
jgi:hypothetical protein